MNKKTKNIITYAIFFAIAAVLVWLVSRQVAGKKDDIIKAFQNADYFWVGISAIAAILSHLLRAWRWNYLLEPLGHRAKNVNAVGSVFIGYLVNYAVPRFGEVSRCTVIAKYDKIPFEKAFGTVVTERIVDFVLLLLIFVLTLLFQFSQLYTVTNEYILEPFMQKMHVFSERPILAVIAVVVIIVGVAGLFVLRKKIGKLLSGKFGNLLKGFGQGISSVRRTKGKGMFMLLSVGIWTMYLLGVYFCFFAFGETKHLGIKEALVVLLFGTFGVIFAPSGGLGAYQLIIFNVLTITYHIAEGAAFALPWVVWSVQLIVIVLVGVASLIILPLANKNNNVAEQQTV